MSYNYGLSLTDFHEAQKKLNRQRSFLDNNYFTTASGQIKSLLDVSFSANLSERYYPRILNKVNTFVSYSMGRDLVPVFLTVTLDGFFRDLMRGDKSRYNKVKDLYTEHIPNNDRNGYYRDMIASGYALTPKDLYKILSHQMHRFTRSHALQRIRKRGDDYTMIRVTEPHKDGVPHFHILMYIPEKDIVPVYDAFAKFFPAPRNRKRITIKDGGRSAKEIFPDSGIYETVGFQTLLRSPGGYILKYILKSFRNLIEGKELDYLQAWYLHNKIPRIITTHTLLSQDAYYHMSMLDDDWYYLTNIKHYQTYIRDIGKNIIYLNDNGRQLIYDNGLYQIIHHGHLVKEFGSRRKHLPIVFHTTLPTPLNLKYSPELLKISPKFWKFTPKRKYKYKINMKGRYIPIELDGHEFLMYDFETGEVLDKRNTSPVTSLSDFQLFEWFYNYDFDKYPVVKFGYLKKTMIDRGLLEYEDVVLDDYNTDLGEYDYV